MDETRKTKTSFSLELNTRNQIKRVALPDGSGDKLIVEGNLGRITDLVLVEDILLEVIGDSGKIRIDITRKDLERVLRANKVKVV
ncbi:MAG: hypothetical protein NWF07_11705 [Candidatus Bathyarchaeota archaeon]|nr:hypothetical protein [Candidatus Bathyarchaeota archaeon]